MGISIFFIIIILLFGLVATLMLGGKSDEDYSKSTKKNTLTLTAIYAVVIIGSLVGVGLYIIF